MQSCLIELTNKVNKIKEYIDYIENTLTFNEHSCELEVACTVLETYKKHSYNEKKIIEYNALIISLYGAYENFINQTLEKYLTRLTQIIPEYDKFPQQLKECHFTNTIQILKDIDTRKYSKLDKNELIKNIYNCENNNESYQINFEAILLHSSNMWIDTVNDLLKRVGVNDFFNKLKIDSSFKQLYLKRCEGDISEDQLTEIISSRTMAELTSPLYNLISERNRVAHSWVDSINIEIIKEQYTNYVEVICRCVYNILEENILKYEREYNCKLIHVSEKINRNVFVFNEPDCIFYKDEKIIIERGDGDILEYGIIKNIKIDDKDVNVSVPNKEIGVYIESSNKITNSSKFYKINSSIPIAYSPTAYTDDRMLCQILENPYIRDVLVEELENKCIGQPFNMQASTLEWFEDLDIYKTTIEELNFSEQSIGKTINFIIDIIAVATGVGYYMENTYCSIPMSLNAKVSITLQLGSIELNESNIYNLAEEDIEITDLNMTIKNVEENVEDVQFIEDYDDDDDY